MTFCKLEDALAIAQSENTEDASAVEVDIEMLAEEAKERLAHMSQEVGVDVQIDVEAGLRFRTEPVRLNQIVENLLSNGIKYADPDREKRFVHLVALRRAGALCLRVEDNGLGIPERRHPVTANRLRG